MRLENFWENPRLVSMNREAPRSWSVSYTHLTGLRPGEKLYEELLMNEEGMTNTENELIHIGKPIEMDAELFWKQMDQLHEYCEANIDEIKEKVAEVVQTYKPQNGC